MHILAIDVGSYSVKMISSRLEKKKTYHLELKEYLIHETLSSHPEFTTPEDATMWIIKEIITDFAENDSKIITNFPNQFITTRFLTLPVKNRKKADMMVPFQLEENIPYSLAEAHYGYRIDVQKSQSLVLACLVKLSTFENYFDKLRSNMVAMPNYLSTDSSLIATYYSLYAIAGPFCVLDIGHSSTKGYFFYNSRLILTHTSYVGGKHIDEMIGRTYRLSPEEALNYKHQNAFVLTSPQFEMVDDSQKEFALLMDEVLKPLIYDFQRWELGFRVQHGLKVAQVFITGGTSSIKNMAPYLTERFSLKTTMLETYEGIRQKNVDLNQKSKAKFTVANLMVLSLRAKTRLINLLSGRFAQQQTTDLPLHSLAYISVRTSAVALFMILFMIIDSSMVKDEIKEVNTKLANILKNETLQIPKSTIRALDKNPKAIMDKLMLKQKALGVQMMTLESAHAVEALSPLVKINAQANKTSAELIRFKVDDFSGFEAEFKSDDLKELANFEQTLKTTDLNILEVKLDNNKLILKATE